jgi:hypothetical protein
MNTDSNINPTNGRFLTQSAKIEGLLRSRYGQWIPAYELADLALQYCARLNSIRRKLRHAGDRERIENKTQRVNGQIHGSYRIVRTADALGLGPPKPAKTWEQVCQEREQILNQPIVCATSDLPLFAGSSL